MCVLFQNLPQIVYFVIASRYKRRGDPGPLDCFVANAPRNDDPMIYLNLNNNHMA